MVEEIRNILEKRSKISFSELKKKLKIYGDVSRFNELKKSLSLLEAEGVCFFNDLDNNVHLIDGEYIFAEIQTSKKGNLFIIVNGEYMEFSAQTKKLLLPFDKVILDRDLNLMKIVERKINTIVLEIIKTGKKKAIKVIGNPNLSCYIDDAALNDNMHVLDLPEGTRFIATLDTTITNNGYKASFQEVISHKNDFDDDLMAIAYNNGFRVLHTPEELAQVKNVPTYVSDEEISKVEDHRQEEIFTIDGVNTKDIDDAISVELLPNGNYLLKVYIAHVSHYVKFGSPLWKRAEENTTSLYFANKVSHMLHHLISNGICSLNEGEDRLAKGYFTEITPDGNIVSFKPINTVIRSKKKMTYDDVNSILENGIIPPGYEPFVDSLSLANKLAKLLANKRKNNGAISVDNAEVSFELNDENQVEKISLSKQKTSEHLIENLMVITNEAIADYMINLGITSIFRNHEIPYDDRIHELKKTINQLGYKIKNVGNTDDPMIIQRIISSLKNKEEFFVLVGIILKTLPRAYYSTENRGHFGLASKGYSQSTSPIRRFLDLVIETIFDNLEYFFSEKCDMNSVRQYLDTVCKRASMMERMADKGEYEAEQLRMCEYIANFPDEVYEAYVYKITDNKVILKTKGEHIEGIVLIEDLLSDYDYDSETNMLYCKKSSRTIKIGSQMYIKLKFADKDQREIYFSEEEKPFIKTMKYPT